MDKSEHSLSATSKSKSKARQWTFQQLIITYYSEDLNLIYLFLQKSRWIFHFWPNLTFHIDPQYEKLKFESGVG